MCRLGCDRALFLSLARYQSQDSLIDSAEERRLSGHLSTSPYKTIELFEDMLLCDDLRLQRFQVMCR